MEQGSTANDIGHASKLLQLVESMNTLEPVAVARALQIMNEDGLPSTAQQAVQLRNTDAVSTLVVLLEPTYGVTLRSHALHVIARMCRLDRVCQESFINHGVVRKLIKNADPTQGGEVDAPAAIRALARLAGGDTAGPLHIAAVEDVFLSGLLARMRGELSARRHLQDDPLLAAIADFLASAAACPAHHITLRDASLLPLLPGLLEIGFRAGAGGGGAAAASFLDVVFHLSTSDAVAPALRTELFYEALAGVLTSAPALSTPRRTALLAICNIFGADADNVRVEEVLRVNGAPPMLVTLLAAALGPADIGVAARTTGAAPAGGGGLQRRSGGASGNGGGGPAAAARGMRVSDGGLRARGRMSNNGGGGVSSALDAMTGWSVRTLPEDSLSSAAAGPGNRKGAGDGYALTSITAPGLGGGGGGGDRRTQQMSGDGAISSDAPPPVPLEFVLHSLKCIAANPMLARKLAKPGSPAYVLPSLFDAVVASLQHATAGTLPRAVAAARTAAGAQTLLRLATCAELVPALRAAGAAPVLRMLALEADDPRVGEAACGALLYMGETGLVGYTSRPAAAAFRALYRNGTASPGADSELGSRFHVFVSHHRADAHQFAMFTLHPMLVLQGVPAFVDPQHRTASSDWSPLISSCKNMVVVLSEMLLASPDHLRESEAAVAAGANLVVVLPEGARWTDSQGNKSLASPPPAVLLRLPTTLRVLFAEQTMPYSASRHGEFTEQLMARLQLPAATPPPAPAADGSAAESSSSTSPGRLRGGGDGGGGHRASGSGMAAGRGASRGRGRWTGQGDEPQSHRVSFTGVSDVQNLEDEEGRTGERAGDVAEAAGASLHQLLPWPWSRLLEGAAAFAGDDDDELVRYPRPLNAAGAGNGVGNLGAILGGAGDPFSGSAARESATGMAAQHTAAPPPAGAPVSYTSRRFTARQRSSINRHAAMLLQQQQQQILVQQHWLQEFQLQQQQQQPQPAPQPQPQSILLASPASLGSAPSPMAGTDDGTAPLACGSVRGGGRSGSGAGSGSEAAATWSMMSQLLALQMEMVRYELRQAVQASHDNITYKIDRLRSDVTEQVVQLRFDLAGKIEALQEALSKAVSASRGGSGAAGCASPSRDVKDGPGGGGAAAAAGVGGSGGSTREQGSSPSPTDQQQLAAALSTSLAASLRDAVDHAVAQLQATVTAAAAAGTGSPVRATQPPAAFPSTAAAHGGGAAATQKGHQGAVAMLAAAAAQQQQQLLQGQYHSPHPPGQPSNHPRAGAIGGHGAAAATASGANGMAPQGVDFLSPVARAGAAAWSGDGGGGTAGHVHGGGAKSRSSHPAVANGTLNGGGKGTAGGGGGNGTAAPAGTAPLPPRQGALAMFDAAVAEDEAAGGGGMDGRVMSPTALLASITSPATAQAALLLAGRSRPHVATAGGGVGGGGGSGGGAAGNAAPGHKDRSTSAHASAGGGGGGKATLPPLAGLVPSFTPSIAGKLVERTEAQPVRKAQQQQLLMQQQQQQQQVVFHQYV